MNKHYTPTHEIEVFFDGDCPLCTKEIRMLQRLDRRDRIRFTDIAAPGFAPRDHVVDGQAVDMAWFMDEIRGRLPDGTWITGVEVFRRLYGAVGLRPVVGLTRLPGVSHALDAGYRAFARNRLKLTGRCDDGACAVPEPAG